MSGAHPDLGPELRQLAQVILDKLDPAIRLAAARVADGAGAPGQCQQVWCPVCALAALINGEQHPLLSVAAEHSVALVTVLRAMVGDGESPPSDMPAPPTRSDVPAPPTRSDVPGAPGRYEHIPVSFEE